MNNVAGIDVSKGKSMVSVLRPFGEVVAKPFSIGHTGSELKELADYLKSLDGETRVGSFRFFTAGNGLDLYRQRPEQQI